MKADSLPNGPLSNRFRHEKQPAGGSSEERMNDMLYPHSREPFSPALFRCPGSEYRGTPFWAWNCRLDPAELMRQIEIFRQMGFGGFHMHVRTGMETPYLSEEHMDRCAAAWIRRASRRCWRGFTMRIDGPPARPAGW